MLVCTFSTSVQCMYKAACSACSCLPHNVCVRTFSPYKWRLHIFIICMPCLHVCSRSVLTCTCVHLAYGVLNMYTWLFLICSTACINSCPYQLNIARVRTHAWARTLPPNRAKIVLSTYIICMRKFKLRTRTFLPSQTCGPHTRVCQFNRARLQIQHNKVVMQNKSKTF